MAQIIAVFVGLIVIGILLFFVFRCKLGIHKWRELTTTVKEGELCSSCGGKGYTSRMERWVATHYFSGVEQEYMKEIQTPCNFCKDGWKKPPVKVISGNICDCCKKYIALE